MWDLTRVADAWRAHVPATAREWIPANILIPDTTETPGPFSLNLCPHVAGVLDAVDDPDVREIYLDWATRSAKTITSLSAAVYFARELRCPMVLAACDEDRVDDLIDEAFLPLLRDCRDAPSRVKRHSRHGVLIEGMRVRKAYAGSPGTLAGYPARVGLANEAGLWPPNMLRRLLQRGRLFPFTSKFLVEGKRETVGECGISALVDADTTQRRYRFVRCPHCGTYQRLSWGYGQPGPGVKWTRARDPVATAQTAWYQCVSGCRVEDVDRAVMMRDGVWVPEGSTLSADGVIGGTPLVPARNVAFTGLSSLYSLTISGWSQLVYEWFASESDPEARREFITGTLGEAYDPKPASAEPTAIATALRCDDHPLRGQLPEWSRLLTCGVDLGAPGGDLLLYWLVCAWACIDGKPRGAVIDWGISTEPEFSAKFASWQYATATGRVLRMSDQWGALDASDGNVTIQAYQLADRLPAQWWACKGDAVGAGRARSATRSWYSWGVRSANMSKARAKVQRRLGIGDLLMLSSNHSQLWRRSLVQGRIARESPDFVSLPADVCDAWAQHSEFLGSLDADVEIDGRWRKSGANEFGDALRIARVVASLAARGETIWPTLTPPAAAEVAPVVPHRTQSRRSTGTGFAAREGGRR